MLIKKIISELSRVPAITKVLLQSKKLPEFSEAMSYLQNLSPDVGGSCWTDDGFEYEDRNLLLSVIVPAYNVENYVVNCLESILRQQVSFEYEIIVVNDGSTDTTPSLLEKYEHHEHIHIFHQENQGLSAARNKGIAHSKGQYLCFVDSDDELAEGALEALVTAALKHQAKLVVGSLENCLRNGTVRSVNRFKDEKADVYSLPGYPHCRIVHYTVFQNLRFPKGYWYEDSIMAEIVHPVCTDDAYTVSQSCYKYYFNEAGISNSAKGKPKSLDSLWITMRLLEERMMFGLVPTQKAYEYFLLMVSLTYKRTKYLGSDVARCVFVVQKMLIDRYYKAYEISSKHKYRRLQKALRTNNFRKYILACELKF